jgi:hypothetical protein
MIRGAERPLIMLGAAASRPRLSTALSERDCVHQAIDKADLIVAIGHNTVPNLFKRARN